MGDDKRRRIRESSDDYPNVVVVLEEGKSRVIRDHEDLQWIVQGRRAEGDWKGYAFCRSKEALLQICNHPALADLPDGVVYPVLKYGRWASPVNR